MVHVSSSHSDRDLKTFLSIKKEENDYLLDYLSRLKIERKFSLEIMGMKLFDSSTGNPEDYKIIYPLDPGIQTKLNYYAVDIFMAVPLLKISYQSRFGEML